MLTVQAYAKINLTLEILGKRGDGYHEIASVLQTIGLADVLAFESAGETRFVCRDSSGIRADLLEVSIFKAVDLLREETGCAKGALIQMESVGIPRAVGLGSSSTDSAATLKGLNELWELGLSLDELIRLAAKLGSDTPFFIRGGTTLAEGRGEQITPLPELSPACLVLLIPSVDPFPDKTAKMYGKLTADHFTGDASTRNMLTALKEGTPLSFGMLCNTFEEVAFDFFPRLGEYRQIFLEAGAGSVHLAGSGPALFTLVPDEAQGEKLANRLNESGLQTFLTHTL